MKRLMLISVALLALIGLSSASALTTAVPASAPPSACVPPQVTQEASFAFAAFGDSADGTPQQLAVAARMTDSNPAFVIHLGDMIFDHTRTDLWQSGYYAPYASILSRTCIFHALGNHDLDDGGVAWTRNVTNPHNNPLGTKDYYSFNYRNAHFIVLNSNQNHREDVSDLHPTDFAQLSWLRDDLADSYRDPSIHWRIVAFHGAAYSSGVRRQQVADDLPGQVMSRDYVPVFEQYGVDLVLQGHDLDYERTCQVRQGVCTQGAPLYIVSGGGGYPVLTGNVCPVNCGWSRAFASTHHFVKVAVNQAVITLTAVDVNGRTIDTAVIAKDA